MSAAAGTLAPPLRSKVEIARERVRRVNPWSEILALELEVETLGSGLLAQVDAAVIAVDNPRARFLSTRLLLGARRPWIDTGALAPCWQARVSVFDPSRRLPRPGPGAAGKGSSDGAPPADSCLVCGWSEDALARAGEDVGRPCAGVQTGEGAASTLTMGHRAGTTASRELLAATGVVDLEPSVGFELRDDLAWLRLERFRLPGNPHCAADHDLARAPLTGVPLPPDALELSELAARCGLDEADEIVLDTAELVETAACADCRALSHPYRRSSESLSPCPDCGGERFAARRTRRVLWGSAAPAAARLPAAAWFAPGAVFAARGPAGLRGFAFPAPAVDWEPGADWCEAEARECFRRLPPLYDLAEIRRRRIALVGLGFVGSAVLQQLAPLPWRGLLLVDRDPELNLTNRQAHAFGDAAGVRTA